jgi:hypothetical protein
MCLHRTLYLSFGVETGAQRIKKGRLSIILLVAFYWPSKALVAIVMMAKAKQGDFLE